MSLTDAQRLQIYEAYKTEHGEALAEVLMTTIPPFDWNELATKSDFARLETATKSDFARLETTTKSDFARLEANFARLETATKSDFARLEANFARLEATTKADIARFEATTRAGIAQLGTDLRFEFKYELGQTELRLQRSFMNALWASQGAFAAVVAIAIALATIFG